MEHDPHLTLVVSGEQIKYTFRLNQIPIKFMLKDIIIGAKYYSTVI